MTNIEPEPAPSTGGGFLTSKYGPLPGWAWLVITVAVVFVFMKIQSSKAKTGTTTGGTTGSSTGTNAALSSNLVAFQEPVPTLNGTYQVQVTPENAPNSIYATTPNSSTQGVTPHFTPPANWMQSGGAPAPSPAVNVQPQTQSSSPQTQSNVG